MAGLIEPMGPTISLLTAMLLAVLLAPEASVVIAEPRISTTIPNFRSPLLRATPSSSFTVAVLSSKRTPLTMIDPYPLIGPLAYVAAPPVPPLSTPPPQPTSKASIRQERSQAWARARVAVGKSMFMSALKGGISCVRAQQDRPGRAAPQRR
ncbi:MAG: hypothetical protein WA210_02440 [Burkholderiaceae bacterium]